MSEVLELAHLPHRHHVSQVEVHLRRVEPAVDAQGAVLFQTRTELALHRPAGRVVAELSASHEDGHLVGDRGHATCTRNRHANHSRVVATSARICSTRASGPLNFISGRNRLRSSIDTTCP